MTRLKRAWSGAVLVIASGLAAVLASALLIPSVVLSPGEDGSAMSSTPRSMALLLIALELAGVAAAIATWFLLSSERVRAAVRAALISLALQLTAVAVAVFDASSWANWNTGDQFAKRLPTVLVLISSVALVGALASLKTLRGFLARLRSADATTVDGYIARLEAGLQTTPRRRARILSEVAEHLRDSATELGEREATERFGTPEKLAATFEAQTLVANVSVVVWSALAATAAGLFVLIQIAGDFLDAGSASVTSPLSELSGRVWMTSQLRLLPIESFTSQLSNVPPPLRGGLALAIALAATFGFVLAVAAVIAKNRPRLAGKLAALSLTQAVLAGVLVAVISQNGYRDYRLALPPMDVWGLYAAAILVAAALWCLLELAPKRVPTLRSGAVSVAVIAMPLFIATAWSAPSPAIKGLLQPFTYPPMNTYLGSVPSGTDGKQVALTRVGPETIVAWVGLSRAGRSVRVRRYRRRPRSLPFALVRYPPAISQTRTSC